MPNLPPLAAVRVFEAAARHENFSRAAEELAMTQAGVSYQMKVLEERLGAPLFVRRGRNMVLTELGRRIAPRVTRAFAAIDEAFALARSESESVLSITAPRTFATNWLSNQIGSFNIAQPELAVRIDITDAMVDLAASDFDVAIRGISGPPDDLVSHFLMHMPVTPMASPAFLERHPIATPDDLWRAPRLSPDDDWWDLWFETLATPGQRDPAAGGIRFESQGLDGQAAIAGHGVAILSPPMFAAAEAAGQLVRPFAHVAPYRNSFWLVYPDYKRHLPKVRAFRDWLLAAAKASLGDDPDGALRPLAAAIGEVRDEGPRCGRGRATRDA